MKKLANNVELNELLKYVGSVRNAEEGEMDDTH